jgi:copper(I)-binding protein
MVLAVLLTVAGAMGLLQGALSSYSITLTPPTGSPQPIVVSGAYVREPANGVNAAAYFTLYDTTDTPDVLTAVDSGAGEQTTLHTESFGGMRQVSQLSIPARGSVSLEPGRGHVMIDKLYGPLKAGQSVNLRLTFAKAGQVLLTVPVIAIGAPAPTAEAPR